ncbi:hypothetical protein Tco_0343950 [Tanacetum coccineum]
MERDLMKWVNGYWRLIDFRCGYAELNAFEVSRVRVDSVESLSRVRISRIRGSGRWLTDKSSGGEESIQSIMDSFNSKMQNMGLWIGQSVAFTSATGMEQVMEKVPWMIHNQPLLLNKWTPNLALSKDEVKKVLFGGSTIRYGDIRSGEDGIKLSFCSFVYADSLQVRCRHLWEDLDLHKNMVRGQPWVLIGDFNAALNLKDIFSGSSVMNASMIEFKDCVANIEVVDINASGLYYTWNQKLRGGKGILKKLDRCMVNMEFINEYVGAYAIYHPYRSSDHAPVVLKMPNVDTKKPRPKKAKVDWLEAGDANTAYFHKTIKSQTHRSRIEVIRDVNGVEYIGLSVPEAFVNHYKDFLGTDMLCDDMDSTDLFLKQVSKSSYNDMVCDIMNVEIKSAMFDIGDDRAPGPDRFSSTFFKKGWDILGYDVCKSIQDFFRNRQILREINHTFISLIPEDSIPLRINDYHPISCCNVIYKCISKILTNRIISGIKDVAYDTVDWKFLEHILHKFGFNPVMIKWIMACVTSSSFSIGLNGDIHGFFKGKRGLRQGDPLSPYLFTLVMEVLTLMLKKKVRLSNSFWYHHKCEALEIINVCFADDLFIFSRGDVNSATVIMESLDEFKRVSGLVPSIPKSTVFFCNVGNTMKNEILGIMPFLEGNLPAMYLGVPLISSRLLNRDCKILVEKAKNRIGDWKNKSLSFAGRLQLCKSILSSMQIYWASVLVIPKGIIDDIQQLTRGFLWCNGELKRGKAKIRWRDFKGLFHDFSVARAWDAVRPRGNIINWHKIVWFSHAIPRHSFHMWLVMRKALNTQDKLRMWDLGGVDPTTITHLAGMDPY